MTSIDTNAIHGAHTGARTVGPLSTPLDRSTTYGHPDSESLARAYRERADGMYMRFGHVTMSRTARRVADLEGGEHGLMFGSGMGAISTTLLALLGPGDHVVAHAEIFAQTQAMIDYLVRAAGVQATIVDARDTSNVAAAIRPNTRVIYVETPSNPLLHVMDVAALAPMARSAGAHLIVDSTFASPIVQQPLRLGASIVVHSGTKYLGGHSDLMAGFAVGSRETMARIHGMQVVLGTVADPQAAWLIQRSLPTLPLRVRRQCASALTVARFLSDHPRVERVAYPMLDGDPGNRVAREQMTGGGGVLSFVPHGGVTAARRTLDALRLIPIATSLGGVESVAELPYDLDFGEDDVGASRERAPAMIRLSVGLEDADDLIADLRQALERA